MQTMPEEIEIPTEHLHEEIQEKAEEQREKWTLYVALSTALMAVLAAVAGLLAGHHANEALIERVKASDQWNFYQAKNLKQEIAINTDQILPCAGEKTTIPTIGRITAPISPGTRRKKRISRKRRKKTNNSRKRTWANMFRWLPR